MVRNCFVNICLLLFYYNLIVVVRIHSSVAQNNRGFIVNIILEQESSLVRGFIFHIYNNFDVVLKEGIVL